MLVPILQPCAVVGMISVRYIMLIITHHEIRTCENMCTTQAPQPIWSPTGVGGRLGWGACVVRMLSQVRISWWVILNLSGLYTYKWLCVNGTTNPIITFE